MRCFALRGWRGVLSKVAVFLTNSARLGRRLGVGKKDGRKKPLFLRKTNSALFKEVELAYSCALPGPSNSRLGDGLLDRSVKGCEMKEYCVRLSQRKKVCCRLRRRICGRVL